MPARYRFTQDTRNGYYRNKSTGNTIYYSRYLSKDEVNDVTGPGDGKDLDIDHFSCINLTPLSGSNSTHEWSEFIPGGLWTNTSHISFANLGVPSDGVFATSLIAKTNPNRSSVDIPVAMAELRELPSLLKKWGDSIFEKIATGNLTFQFAIKPLVSDIMSMCNLVSLVEARVKEVQALMSSGLRRKRSLGRYSATDTMSITMQTGAGTNLNLSVSTTRTTFCKVWGFVEYKPTSILKSMNNEEIITICRNAALGLYLDGYNAWNLIPWSWFIDWFFNFGDWLSIQRNEIPVSISTPQIMKERVTFLNHRKTNASSDWPSNFTTKVVSKSRNQANASVSSQMSLLSQKQWGILGSLAVLRL